MQNRPIDVFISYSNKDQLVADAVCKRLESGNVRCWYASRDIAPGADWASSIMQAIKRARIFLLIYSESSNQSRQVYNELTAAFNAGCRIVPFRLDASEMDGRLAYYLNAVHWMDALTPPLESHIEYLYRYVLNVLQSAIPTPHQVPAPPTSPRPPEKKTKRIIKWIAMIMGGLLAFTVGMFATMFLLNALNRTGETNNGDSANAQLSENSTSQIGSDITENPVEPLGVQDIKLQQLHQAGDYSYPGYSISMLDTKSNLFLMVKEGSDDLYIVNMRTGKKLVSGIQHDFADLEQVSVITTAEYDTLYFVDEADDRILIFNRRTGEWINREGLPLSLSDTEYYYTYSYDEHSFRSNNEEMENICLFIYDYEQECFSQLIWITPDGIRDTLDVRHLGLTDIVQGFRSEFNMEYQALMLDTHLNLVVLDILNGQLLDLSFDTILNDYIPKLAAGSTILSADGRYLMQYDSRNAKVWDLRTDKLVFNRDFTNSYTVSFGADHEVVYYSWSDNALHIYDLQTQMDRVQLDEAFFLEHDGDFYDVPSYVFYYSHEYDLYFWTTFKEQSDGSMDILLTVTDKEGNVYAKSDDMAIPASAYWHGFIMSDNYLLVAFLATQDAPDDVPNTLLYRAIFSEDSAGRLVFADVYYYDE